MTGTKMNHDGVGKCGWCQKSEPHQCIEYSGGYPCMYCGEKGEPHAHIICGDDETQKKRLSELAFDAVERLQKTESQLWRLLHKAEADARAAKAQAAEMRVRYEKVIEQRDAALSEVERLNGLK
jgi:hypothetical protein